MWIAMHGSWWWLQQILCLSSFTLNQYKLLATVLYSGNTTVLNTNTRSFTAAMSKQECHDHDCFLLACPIQCHSMIMVLCSTIRLVQYSCSVCCTVAPPSKTVLNFPSSRWANQPVSVPVLVGGLGEHNKGWQRTYVLEVWQGNL